MTPEAIRANEIAREKGASNWLTAIPRQDLDFHLSKREFWDAVSIRYTWPLKRMPSRCACGDSFDFQHALSCKKGGFVVQRHNELRDLTADLLSQVCKDVAIEPSLESLSGETFQYKSTNISPGAHLDVSARGFWQRGQRAFFDIRVMDPKARRYKSRTLPQADTANEREKKRHYNEGKSFAGGEWRLHSIGFLSIWWHGTGVPALLQTPLWSNSGEERGTIV